MMRYLIPLILLFLACKPEFSAETIVDKSIKASNMDQLKKSTIRFIFRKNTYTATRNFGKYKFTKTQVNDSVMIKDVLTNFGFQRYIDDKEISLSTNETNRYRNSLNSVHYFSVLPYVLNDNAVRKKLLGKLNILGKEYYKIEVTFSKNRGGDDYDDVFLYWFDTTNFNLDYVAYIYHRNGGGIRFRAIKNEYVVEGIRFLNYYNYKPLDANLDFYQIDKAYENEQLKKISEIVLENIEVAL